MKYDDIKVGDHFLSRLQRTQRTVEVIGFHNGYIEYTFLDEQGQRTSANYQWATKPKSFYRQFRRKEEQA